MLYSPQQFQRDQLLADLLAVRERLQKAWLKGGFTQGQRSCIVAAAQQVTSQPVGFTRLPAEGLGDQQLRLGRALVAVYMALYGPKAPRDVTMLEVQRKIASFNDGAATHASVLLLLDRAVAAVQAQAGVQVVAQC